MPPYQASYPLPVHSCSYPSIYPSLNEYLVQNSSEETQEFRPGFPARSPTDFYNFGGGGCPATLCLISPKENYIHSTYKYVLNRGNSVTGHIYRALFCPGLLWDGQIVVSYLY